MGVDLQTWIEVISRHPMQFEFEGLDGWWKTVGEAATHDERFMERYFDKERDSYEQELGKEIKEFQYSGKIGDSLERYLEHLDGLRNIDMVDLTTLEKLNLEEDGDRWEWADAEIGEPEWAWEILRSKDEEPYLLKKHPPIKIMQHASGYGIDLEDVVFICPSCGREPAEMDDIANGGVYHFYCGLCGCDSLISEWIPDEENPLPKWAEDVGVKLYPFRKEK